jgi:tetratricopeptide (TPR) repeat protein
LEQDGSKRLALAIGYFRTQQDAQVVRDRAVDRFPAASVLKMEPAGLVANAVSGAAVAASAPPADASAASAALPDAESVVKVTQKAAELLNKGQLALTQQRFQEAVDAFNQALMLPPNPSSQRAQELIGNAWEGLKQTDKARIEYQLYLKLYPEAEATQRVAQRLLALGGPVVAGAAKPADKVDSKGGQTGFTYTGSISQYYYGGRSKTDSLVNISAGIDQSTLSQTNQSALVTSVDMSGRYKSDSSETKIVLRDTYSKNFITSTNTLSGLSAIYVDYRVLDPKLDIRLGRQSAIGGSLFGLFDGVSLAMPIWGKFKLDAMVGVPANTLVSAPSQRLAGVMLEADNLFEHWGGNVSLVDQTSEGISDRRATGLELRYFGESVSMYSQLDYDLNFRTLNAATLQGSVQGPFSTTITFLLDNRKAPSLQLSDALISSNTTSLKTLLQMKSLAEVKDMALGTAAQARQALFSISRALSPKWQGSLDFRYSDVGALPAVGDFQAMPATGAQYNISAQLTGSNLYSNRDINGFNVSVLHSDTLRGTQLAYNNLTGFLDNKASFEPSLRFYTQTDNTSTKVQRLSPGVRLSYKLSDRASLLGEAIYERSTTDGPTNHEDSSAVFFYVGYRYDFF